MADAEIEILIKAVDQMSGTLQKIEGTLEKSGKNIEKINKNTTKSFDKQMGSVLVLGQAASSVNNIFDTYENTQLRLENATNRVYESQDRLREMQYKLSKLQQTGTATAEDLANAQQDITSATRGLENAQNNLARAQNKVFDSYLSIGLQIGVLISTLPTLISSVWSLVAAAAAFVATPLGLVLTAAAIAIGLLVGHTISQNREQAELQKKLDETKQTAYDKWLNEVKIQQTMLNSQLSRSISLLTQQYDALTGLIKGPLEGEAELQLEMARQQEQVSLAERDMLLANTEDAKISAQEKLNAEMNTLNLLQNEYDIRFANYKTTKLAETELTRQKEEEKLGVIRTTYSLIDKRMNEFKNASFAVAKQVADENVAQAGRVKSAWEDAYSSFLKAESARQKAAPTTPQMYEKAGGTAMNLIPKYGDFISRPGQQPVSFSPEDTIIGAKNPTGTTIVINGDIYGYEDFKSKVDRALYDNLKNKIGQL